MENGRFYVILPQTVQVVHPAEPSLDIYDIPGVDIVESYPMVHGRLMAQNLHAGRLLGYMQAQNGVVYCDTTAITLAVRNSKELTKVSKELKTIVDKLNLPETFYQEFHDHNPLFYGTVNRVHTITVVGPVEREMVEEAIGHLELY